MACFIAPMAEAIVVTIAKKGIEKNGSEKAVSVAGKLGTLNNLLWGGSALLAFEHVWHGEVVPFYPFLTAAKTAEGTAEMLKELATRGTCMALLITAVWGATLAISAARAHKKAAKTEVVE